MRWQPEIVDWPARVTAVITTWLRFYLTVVFALGAITAPAMVLLILVLWFGFGIRWGW